MTEPLTPESLAKMREQELMSRRYSGERAICIAPDELIALLDAAAERDALRDELADLRELAHTIDRRRDELAAERDALAAVVTTVGDLTARHIGKRVRVETDRTLPHRVRLLREIATASNKAVRLTLEVIDHPEWFLMAHFTLDTPCEVIE